MMWSFKVIKEGVVLIYLWTVGVHRYSLLHQIIDEVLNLRILSGWNFLFFLVASRLFTQLIRFISSPGELRFQWYVVPTEGVQHVLVDSKELLLLNLVSFGLLLFYLDNRFFEKDGEKINFGVLKINFWTQAFGLDNHVIV
jgi:hypothetical protein